jgi:hypothetical protein
VNPPGTTPPTQKFEYNVANAYIVTIGAGTTPSNFPFTTYWMDGRTQYLYTASEINMATGSSVSKIGFDVIAADPAAMNGFKVSFQNTALTSLTGFVTSGWTTSYSPASYAVPGTGWQMIQLTNPFQYTGGNLLVEICYNNSAYTQYSTVNSSPGSGNYWGRYQDMSSGDGCTNQTWTLTTAPPGRANTRLEFSTVSGVSGNENGIPKVFDLKQNYPNPFNPVTKIHYEVPKTGYVSIKVFDMLGREVSTLVNGNVQAGYYAFDFDASALTSGVYFYKMTAGSFEKTMKMIVLK